VSFFISKQQKTHFKEIFTVCAKVRVKLLLYTPRRHIEGAEVYFFSFLTLGIDGDEWSGSEFGRFFPGKILSLPLEQEIWGSPELVWTL